MEPGQDRHPSTVRQFMAKKRRITYATAVVLLAVQRGHRYGFDIMDATGLADGTIYPVLRRMEEAGHMAADWEDAEEARSAGRPSRRYYRLTPSGLEVLRDALERFPALVRLFPGAEEDAELATA